MRGVRTYVVGVGMTKFDKPGSKQGDYPDWAREAGEAALSDAGFSTSTSSRRSRAIATATRPTASGAIWARTDRHPGDEREQQLLDRLERPVARAPSGPRRARECALALGFEKMERGSWA